MPAMPHTSSHRLRVAAISFLNPAPLLWNFEHKPAAAELRKVYDLRYTLPSACAAQLASGEADLGLIPIAALALVPELAAVPGCTIASLRGVRSIQLVLRPGVTLEGLKTVATDSASRSSAAYVRVLLQLFYGNQPHFHEQAADVDAMLQTSDAALLIGDPALLALERRDNAGEHAGCTWIDVATWWREHTGLPWVAAVWAVRPDALSRCGMTPQQLQDDLITSRDAGLQHVEQLVAEWQPRLALPEETIRHYLTQNIHYTLDEPCLAGIARFYELAETCGILPRYRLHAL
jgi:chorismate dehydratase